MFFHRARHGPVELAFTDRHGGASAAPRDSLNLAWADDDPEALSENHRRLHAAFAPDDPPEAVAALSQVHGSEVAVVGPAGPSRDLYGHLHARGDGLVTTQSSTTLMVRAADCVPVLLADPERRVVGAAHCGRGGLVAGIVAATVAAMRDLGAIEVRAWLGPRVCGSCYEVPATMRDEVAGAVPASRATTSWGTPSLDVGAGVHAQLGELGVPVEDVGGCTVESPGLFSYRRDGPESGRMAGLVRMDPAP